MHNMLENHHKARNTMQRRTCRTLARQLQQTVNHKIRWRRCARRMAHQDMKGQVQYNNNNNNNKHVYGAHTWRGNTCSRTYSWSSSYKCSEPAHVMSSQESVAHFVRKCVRRHVRKHARRHVHKHDHVHNTTQGAIRRCLGGGRSLNVFGRVRGMTFLYFICITVSASGLQSKKHFLEKTNKMNIWKHVFVIFKILAGMMFFRIEEAKLVCAMSRKLIFGWKV